MQMKVFTCANGRALLDRIPEHMADHTVFTCNTLEDLLKIAPYSNYDMIVSEVGTGAVNTKKLIRKFRKYRDNGEVRIVLVADEDPSKVRNADKADVFLRPAHIPILPGIIKRYANAVRNREQRLFRRFRKHKAVKISSDSNGIDKVVDISLSGIGFESRFSFNIGSSMRVKVKAWDSRDYGTVEGVIVRKEMRESTIFYGLEFQKPLLPGQTAPEAPEPKEVLVKVPRLLPQDRDREFAFICDVQRHIENKASVTVDFQDTTIISSNVLGNILYNINHSRGRIRLVNLSLSVFHELKMALGDRLFNHYSEKPSEKNPVNPD